MVRPGDSRSRVTKITEAQASLSHREATCPPQAQTHVVTQRPWDTIVNWAASPRIVCQLQGKLGPSGYNRLSSPYQWTYVGVTHDNADNLFAARRPTCVAHEPTVFMTKAEVEAMLKKEKEKATASFIDLKPPYFAEVIVKRYPSKYNPNSRSSVAGRTTSGNTLYAFLIPWVHMPTMLISVYWILKVFNW